MRSLVALPVVTKNIGQLGTRPFFSRRQPRAAGSMWLAGYSESLRSSSKSNGLVVEPSLGWRICR